MNGGMVWEVRERVWKRRGGEREMISGEGYERGRTMRGLIESATSFSHCLHLVEVALAKRGTPQLLGKVRADDVQRVGR